MSIGWLVNDCLTCIPGTKTFWHDLLEWFPNLCDKCNGHTSYKNLSEYIEAQAKILGEPDFIIRNASYFRPLNLKCKTISYLQDCLTGSIRTQQLDICNHSDIVVCNSQFVKNQYEKEITSKIKVIPIGTNFKVFRSLSDKKQLQIKLGVLDNSILFIGSTHPVKGFDIIQFLIANTDYNFCLIMKDDFNISNSRVKVFNRVDYKTVVEIINCCTMLICSSTVETLHLAGVEAMACGLPILATDVGIYHGWEDGIWGRKVKDGDFLSGVKNILRRLHSFSPREYALKEGLDKDTCKRSWQSLLKEIDENCSNCNRYSSRFYSYVRDI